MYSAMSLSVLAKGPQVFQEAVQMTKSYFLWALRVKCSTRLLVNYTKCHGFFC